MLAVPSSLEQEGVVGNVEYCSVQLMQVYSPSRLPTASRNTVAQLVEVSRTTIQVRLY